MNWEIIADNLKKAGFSLGWVSAIDSQGRTIWIVDAHGYGNRFIVRADKILTAFLELVAATQATGAAAAWVDFSGSGLFLAWVMLEASMTDSASRWLSELLSVCE